MGRFFGGKIVMDMYIHEYLEYINSLLAQAEEDGFVIDSENE
jgi:hypothetical protein